MKWILSILGLFIFLSSGRCTTVPSQKEKEKDKISLSALCYENDYIYLPSIQELEPVQVNVPLSLAACSISDSEYSVSQQPMVSYWSRQYNPPSIDKLVFSRQNHYHTIHLNKPIKPDEQIQIAVYNSLGQLHFKTPYVICGNNYLICSLDNIPSGKGVYFLAVECSGDRYHHKISIC